MALNFAIYNLVTNWMLVSALLIVEIIVLCLFCVWLPSRRHTPLKRSTWRAFEYWSIGLTATALVALCSDIRIWQTNFNLKYAELDAINRYYSLRKEVEHADQWKRSFSKSEFITESEAKQLEKDYMSLADWGKRIYSVLPDSITADFLPEINQEIIRSPVVLDSLVRERVREILRLVDEYEAGRWVVIQLRSKTERSSGEFAFFLFAPLLLSTALGLRFTIVYGRGSLEASGVV